MPKDAFFRLSPEKQQRILNAAKEEFLCYKDHYHKASVKRIAEKADIAIGSIYKYFEDKNDLFFQVFNQYKEQPETNNDSSTLYAYSKEEFDLGTNMSETAQTLVETLSNDQTLFHSLIFDEAPSAEYSQRIRTYLEKDRERGLLRNETDADLAVYLYGSLEYIAFQYCRNHGLAFEHDQEILPKLTKIFFFGIYRDEAREEL